ncbi:sugar ABC transporter substrate-binding protein, partial [Streptomyces sp. NPDC059352]
MNKRMIVAACTIGALTLTACGAGKDGGDSANGEVTLKLVAADYGDKASNSSTAYWKDVAER